jgi:hypothetical protein
MNAFYCLGKEDVHSIDETLQEHVRFQWMARYLKKGRNVLVIVMVDNFFTSVKLTNKLKAEDTSIVYTMKLLWLKGMALQVLDTKENQQRMFEQTLNYVFYASAIKYSC